MIFALEDYRPQERLPPESLNREHAKSIHEIIKDFNDSHGQEYAMSLEEIDLVYREFAARHQQGPTSQDTILMVEILARTFFSSFQPLIPTLC